MNRIVRVLRNPRRLLLVLALSPCVASLCLVAQGIAGSPSGPQSQNNANQDNWRRKPTPADAHPDTLSREARQARDEFWTKVNPPPDPITGLYNGDPDGGMGSDHGEIDFNPKTVWVVGTFTSFDVRAASSGALYTEIHLSIGQILSPAKADDPLLGSSVDIGLAGGSLQKTDGSTYEYRTDRYKELVRPGHTYILQLWKASETDFYYQGGGWDVTSGTAQATFPLELAIFQNGKSSIAGLSESDAIKRMRQMLSENAKK